MSAADRVSLFDPGTRAAVDIHHLGVAELQQVGGCRQASLPRLADGQDRTFSRDFADAGLQLAEGDQGCLRQMPTGKFPRLPDVQKVGLRITSETLLKLDH